MRFGWMRRHRTAIASSTVVVAAGASLVVYALADPGYAVHHADLNDAGVWVSNSIEYGAYARIDKPLGQMDASISAGPNKTQEKGNDLDIVQDGNAVFGLNQTTLSLQAFDTAQGRTMPDAAAAVPSGAQVAAGGGDPSGVHPGVLAVLDTKTGDLRATHIDPQVAATGLADVDPHAKALYAAKSAASLAVSSAGTILLATKSGHLVTVRPNANGFDQPVVTDLDLPAPTGPSADQPPTVTAVGETPVALAGTMLRIPDHDPIDLGPVGQAVLQQPGPAAAQVVVAVPAGLLSVDLRSGAVTRTELKTPGVNPVAPVVSGCTYGAWWGGTPTRLTDCPGQNGPWEGPLPGGKADDPLVFRVNRSQVLLNDPRHGAVWNVDGPQTTRIDNWESVLPSAKSGDDQHDKGQTGTRAQPIKANDDHLTARPGRTSVLHVLDNDTYPRDEVIAITSNPSNLSDPQVALAVSQDEQTIAVALPAGTQAAFTFDYTITDSSGGKPSTAHVVVTPQPDGNGAPVCSQCAARTWQVGAGTVLDMPVLSDWRDPENDPLALVSASIGQTAAGQAPPVITADGDILFTAPSRPPAPDGIVHLNYQVSDGFGGVTPAETTIKVLSATDRDGGAPPVARTDVAQATVGRPVTIYPLANDLPGSDPTTDNPTLQLLEVSQRAGASVDVDTVHGSFTFTASKPGPYLLTYSSAYGAQSAVGKVRIDVRQPTRSAAKPVALPDTAVLFGTRPTTVDVLANDYDQGGSVLVVQSAAVQGGSDLQVAVIGGRWLQIAMPNRTPSSVPEYVTYVVSNGTDQATGVVTVREQGSLDTAPVALPDLADVRAGDTVSIPVLDNDIDPAGAPLTLVPGSVDNLTGGGSAYTVGGTIRFIAPTPPAGAAAAKQTSASFDYTVTDGEKSATGTVQVRIHPAGPEAAQTDLPPQPQVITARVVAGGSLTVQIPTSGVDPDGDSVTLVGIREPGPRFGTITSTTSSSIVYAAFPIDFLGTDTIGYRVTDKYGRVGDSLIRIAVVMPGELQPPVPVDDRFEAEPGAELSLDVVSNDIVAAGDTVRVELPETDSGATVDQANPRVLHVTAPPAGGAPLQVRYALIGGTGRSDRLGQLTVIGRDGFDNPPVARDDNAKPVSTTAATVTVPVLKNDADPEGDDLKVTKVWGPATVDPATGNVTVTLADHPQVLPYEISDGTKTASALIFAPAVAHGSAYVRAGKSLQVPVGKDSASIDVNDYVASPDGKTLHLGFPENFTVAPSSGVKIVKKDGTHFILTGINGYVGPGSITLQVTTGNSVADQGASNDYVTIPVQIGDPTAVLRCPVGHTTVVYQGGAPVTTDLAAICHLWLPPGTAADSVKVTTAWKAGAAVTGVNGNFGAGNGTLTLDPTRDAHAGQSGVIEVGIEGSTQKQTIGVRVDKVGPMTLDPITRTGHNAKALSIDVAAAAHTVIRDPKIQVLSCNQDSGEPATCTPQGGKVVVTPADTAKGLTQFSFTVTDVPGDKTRTITGTLSVNVIGRPAEPGTVSADANRTTGGSVRVSWTAPAFDGGAPIDHFEIAASPGGIKKNCTGSTCVIDGLTNGTSYTFAVTTVNTAGERSLKATGSNPATPDKKPNAPSDVQVTSVGNGTVTLSWTQTANGSSAVTGFVIQQQDVTNPATTFKELSGTATTAVIPGLSNSDQYRFRVAAINALTGTAGGPFSSPAVPAQTAGQPATMAAPVVPAQDLSEPTDSVFAHVTWDPDTDPHGGPIDYYKVWRRVQGGTWAPVSQCQKVDPSVRSCDDKVTNDGKTYQYAITAMNSTIPSGYGKESAMGAATNFDAVSIPDTVTDLKAYASKAAFDSRTPDPGPTGGSGAGIDGAIKVSFTVPASHAGSIARMEYSLDGGGSWSTLPGGGWSPGAEGTATISGLTNGSGYSVSVRAVNDKGKTAHASTATPDTYPYGPVPKPTSSASANGGVVSYSAQADTNGRAVDLHVKVNDGDWQDVGQASWSTTKDVGYNKAYSLDVYATDTADQRTDATTKSGRTPQVPAPTGVSCANTGAYSTTIQCTWGNPDTKFVNGFRYSWDNGGWTGTTAGSVSRDFGDYGTLHSIKVEATDGSNWSSDSSAQASTGQVPPPTGVSCSYASDNHKKVTCTWTAGASGLVFRERWGDGNGYGGWHSGTSASNTYGAFDADHTFTVQASSDNGTHTSATATASAKTGPDPSPPAATITVKHGPENTDVSCVHKCYFIRVCYSDGFPSDSSAKHVIDVGSDDAWRTYTLATKPGGCNDMTSYQGADGQTVAAHVTANGTTYSDSTTW